VPPGGFSPRDLPGLTLWLDAGAITGLGDGQPVARWDDASGNGLHATQATATQQPAYRTGVLHGRPVVRFDGGDALQTPSIDHGGARAVTVYGVFSCIDGGGDRIVAELSPDLGTSPNAYAFYRDRFDKLAMLGRGSNNWNERVSSARVAGTAAFHLGCGVYNLRLHRHEAYVYLDGAATSAVTAIFDNDDAATIRTDVLNIGARNQSALFLTGDIAELIIYATAQTATERQRVEGYLASKYGLPARPVTASLLFELDSLTEGGNTYFAVSYPFQLVNRLTNGVHWYNPAISGQTALTARAAAPTRVYPLGSPGLGGKNVCVLWGGTNDLVSVGGNQSAATALARVYGYADDLRAQGFTVVGLTMLPRSDVAAPADFEAKRAAFNADLRQTWASHFAALVDVAADPRIGDAGDELDTAYYDADRVHLNAAGLAIVADLVQPTLAGLGIR